MKKSYTLILLLLLVSPLSLNGKLISLYDCIKIALHNNSTIKKQKATIRQYKYKIKEVESSFYPTINLSGGYSYSGSDYSDSGINNYFLSLNLNQLLFNGLNRINEYNIAKYEKTISMQNYYNAINDLIYNIKDNYFKIILYEKQIEIIKKIIERRKQDLVIIKLRYESGKENSASVMEMEADLKESEYNLLEKEENLKTTKAKLFLLMGVKKSYTYTIDTKNYQDSFPEIAYDNIIQRIEENYPDINIARIQIRVENERLKSIKGEYFPNINLTGSYSFSDNSFFPEYKNWNIGLNISFPLFSGFSTKYKVKKQKNRIEALKKTLIETKNSIKMSLLELVKQYKLLKEKATVIGLKHKAALENYKLIKLQYKQGKTSYLWLKQKETELSGLELQKEQILYNIRTTLAQIEKYIEEPKK